MKENTTIFTSTPSPYEALDPKQGVILGIITSPGIIANFLTIVVTVKLLRHQKMTPNIFVFALACMDLLGIIFMCTPTFLCYIFKGWVGGKHMCQLQGFFTLFFSLGSGFLATAMSMDRFIAVRWPLYHRRCITVNVVKRIVLAILILSALIAFCPVVGFGSFVLNLTGTYCTLNWFAENPKDAAFSCLFASVGFLLIITVLVSNFNVVLSLYRRRRKLTSMVSQRKSGNREESKASLDQQFAKMMIVISAIFLLCWTPFVVRIICNISHVWKSWSADLQSSRLLLLNLVLDPFTYVLTRKHYRRALWTMFCGCCNKRSARLKPNSSSLTSSSRNLRTTKSSDVALDIYKCTNQGREESTDTVDNSIDDITKYDADKKNTGTPTRKFSQR